MVTEEQVIEYFRNLSDTDRLKLEVKLRQDKLDVFHSQAKERLDKYDKNRERYRQSVIKKNLRGEKFKEILKPGMIIKVEGTKDRTGYREILRLDDYRIECRKLLYSRKRSAFIRESYITTHMYSKVSKIIKSETIGLDKTII